MKGLPQGATLSPLLVSMYINDIVSSAEGEFNLFADDTLVYITDKSAANLQRRLQTVFHHMSINLVLHMGFVSQCHEISLSGTDN